MSDIITANLGTIWTFTPQTVRGRRWIRRHVQTDTPGHVVAEHRCGADIALGMLDAGLILEDARTGRIAG